MSREFTFTLRSGVRYDFETGEFFDGTFSLDEDLIVPMSFINRYNGQTSLPWSDAAHAVIVHDIVASQFPGDAMLRFMALHHDDEEVIVGDRTSPMKRWINHLEISVERMRIATKGGLVCDAFGVVADQAQRAIERALGADAWRAAYDASPAARAVVKTADDLAYIAESRILRARKTHSDTMGLPSAEIELAIGLMEDYRLRAHLHYADVRFTYGTGAPAAAAFRQRHELAKVPA